ncbi:MAG TPA: hypothetical protein VFZ09_35060 [Archangium sp.]|uniref:hypothetical protein n=1 Tax=Archangium sp. TaxID=1872627 RepID=UPI002E3400F1|nr:hypothetical protein [Archangium sp.]HEX5751496.1 hypothetical protein [Archangium sp.]
MKTTHDTYKAFTEPLLIDVVGPDGMKRSIHAFPKVLESKAQVISGLEAFKLHLPRFLGQRRGEDLADPDSGSSLHSLLDTEDESHASEVVRRVAQEEIPRRFGKYLDALHAFDVTVHRDARTMSVALALTPHGAERVSWSFELHFPSGAKQERGTTHQLSSPQAMNEPRAAELIRIARRFYPSGFPSWEDDPDEPVLAYQRTPEHQRWEVAWEEALRWKHWASLMNDLRAAFPDGKMGSLTPAYHAACRFCCLYLEQSLPDGSQLVTRVAGAVSILAPLFLVYTTTQLLRPDATSTRPQLSFAVEPNRWTKPYEDKMAHHIERVFGYQPFPIDVADVPLPDLRVGDAHGQSTLLGALFMERNGLVNLP